MEKAKNIQVQIEGAKKEFVSLHCEFFSQLIS